MTGRETPEWQGATADSAIPPRVKLRVFERHNGVCYLTGRKIRAGESWQVDHIVALTNGGANAESNLAPCLTIAHRAKTAADVKERAKVDRVRKYHLGLKKPSSALPCGRKTPWKKKMNGEVVRRGGV